MPVRLGLDAKLYRNTGTYAAPTWNEIQNAKDVTLNMEVSEADVTTRGNAGWKAVVGALRDASIEFDFVWDTAADDFPVLRDAFLTRNSIEFAVMDRDITQSGAQGLRVTCVVTKFNCNQPLDEAITVSVTLKPTFSLNPPAWLVIP